MTPSAEEIRSIYTGIEHRSGLVFDNSGWNSEDSLTADAIAKLRPSVIFDVGVWNGRSTIHMARLCRNQGIQVTIYAIDVFFGLVPGAIGDLPASQVPVYWDSPTRYQQFLFNVATAGFDDCIIPVCNFTRWAARMLAHWNVKAQLIRVDAGHDEDFVYADLCDYWPLLASGGVMTGDDFSDTYPGVKQAVAHFTQERGLSYEVVDGHWKIGPKSHISVATTLLHPEKGFSVLVKAPLKRGLSGYVPVRNGNKMDYCWQLAVQSMLPVCDEVVICVALTKEELERENRSREDPSLPEGDDGTLREAEVWILREPKIRVVTYEWTNPKGDVWMMMKWLNYTRTLLHYDMQITLDADEVIHPDAYPEIRRAVAEKTSRWFRRLNFWQDARHLVPDGQVCGMNVARLGPTEYEMPSDNAEPHPGGEPLIRQKALYHPKLLIFHLGFLRKQPAFFEKSRVMQQAVCGSYDKRLEEAERTGANWWEISKFNGALVPYNGTHPELVVPWLKERGRL